MSRSRKSQPVVSVACVKPDEMARFKRARAKTERARLRNGLAQLDDPDDGANLAQPLAPWDEWACPRDGKQRLDDTATLSEDERRKRLAK